MRLDAFTAPDPDVMWLHVPVGTPHQQWPSPLLVMEVSDTTYRFDTGPKLRKYAFHGIADYWVLNLKVERLEVYRDPQNPTGRLRDCHYASVTHLGRGQTSTVLARPAAQVAVDDLLA